MNHKCGGRLTRSGEGAVGLGTLITALATTLAADITGIVAPV